MHVDVFVAAVRGTHAEIIDFLLKAGSDIHQNGWLGQSAVHTASECPANHLVARMPSRAAFLLQLPRVIKLRPIRC